VRWERGEERGSGSILAVGMVAALFASTAVVLPFALALPVKHRVKDAADAAALAAADVLVGRTPGAPCEIAGFVAEANRADVVRCELDGLVATVTTGATVLGLAVTATSSAGPP
jgi:secretion/DNA translocation related TadE-like protein